MPPCPLSTANSQSSEEDGMTELDKTELKVDNGVPCTVYIQSSGFRQGRAGKYRVLCTLHHMDHCTSVHWRDLGLGSLASRRAALFLQWAFRCGVVAVGSATSDWSAPSCRVGFCFFCGRRAGVCGRMRPEHCEKLEAGSGWLRLQKTGAGSLSGQSNSPPHSQLR